MASSRDRNLKVLVLVLNTEVLVLMPKVSVLKLGLSIVFWQLNRFGIIMLILKCKIICKEKLSKAS